VLFKDEDFRQEDLEAKLKVYTDKGRGLSASLVNWFLENVYRLEATTADDAVVDAPNDKGVDALYVDHNFQEIHIIQAKIRANYDKTIGDVLPKELEGTRAQFQTEESVQTILNGNANDELKKAIIREKIAQHVAEGYKVKGILISNSDPDHNATEYFKANPLVEVWGRSKILEHIVDFDASEKIEDSFSFDVSFAPPLKMSSGGASVYVFAASATELVKLKGISDTTLFSQNVRLSLGRTAVNKSIADSINESKEHKYFPLYHNGIIVLCDEIKDDGDKVTISGYTVVNGAQSITTLYENQSKVSNDLRIFVRAIALKDVELARKITNNSNNQNPTKPRDLKSGDPLMARLQAEFIKEGLPYYFEIKRGEKVPAKDVSVISNDVAGRMLLAFDLGEPESAHQIYKVFEDKYSDIFGRKEVNAHRIILLWRIMTIIEDKIQNLKYRPMGSYALTRYFMLHVVAEILRLGKWSKPIVQDPKAHWEKETWVHLEKRVEELVGGLVIDLNWEVDQYEKINKTTFDYKSAFKSPNEITRLKTELLRSFEKEVDKGKAKSFDVE